MGTYLAALTIYRGLTGRSPPSLAPSLGIAERDDALLHEEIGRTHPLSETMAEKVTALRQWAQGRAARAQ